MSGAVDATLRVAAYCRVSTDKEDQRNSLEAQRRFFLTYIRDHPAWSLVGVFADEGLSGTSIRRRAQFSQLLRRALEGEVDLILTKEVSRFARNTVDALQVTRQLKAKGVGVLFLNDNIDTRDNDGEFRLTIMASVAHEESRKISERTRWGQLQAMKRGVVFGNNSIYGYTLSSGQLTVDPGQAEVVRLVYRKFLEEQKGTHTIARELTQLGIPPPLRPSGPWSSTMVLRLLRNEKYCGDLVQKKFRTTDYLTHRKIPNDGGEGSFCLRDHHPAVVAREQFQQVQAELARRAALQQAHTRFSSRYWHSGKIRCGACGKSYVRKSTRRPNGSEYVRFVCRGHLEGGDPCPMRAVSEKMLLACVRSVLSQLPLSVPALVGPLLEEMRARTSAEAGGLRPLEQAVRRQEDRRRRAVEAFLDGALSREELEQVTRQCSRERERLRLEEKRARQGEAPVDREGIQAFLEWELAGGEAVLEAAVQEITIFPHHIQVELAELPVLFLVRAQGQGTGRDHHITVTECRVLPKGDPIGGPPAGRNIGGAPAQDFRCQIPRPVVQ